MELYAQVINQESRRAPNRVIPGKSPDKAHNADLLHVWCNELEPLQCVGKNTGA